MTRRGRDLLARNRSRPIIRSFGLLPPRDQGGEDRRARGDLHVRRPRQPRTAADRRPAQRAAEALVGGHRQGRQQARRRRDHARAAARLRRLSAQGVRAGPHDRVTSASPDYWGKDVNVNVGRDNFDELRFEYFRDATVAIEAFKADAIDWRTENSAKNWATAYDFPAVKDKRVVKEEFPIDPPAACRALPSTSGARICRPARAPRLQLRAELRGDEQAALLRPVPAREQLFRGHWSWPRAGCRRARSWRSWRRVRDKVPPEVFTTPYTNPVNGSPEAVRNNLREATRLLREAGYEVRDRKLVNAKTGEPLTVEVADRPAGVGAHRAVLQAVARAARHRSVAAHRRRRAIREPAAQLGLRHHRRIVGASRCRPATSSATIWSSQAADTAGSRNYVGIKNPAVDTLIDRIIFAKRPRRTGRRHQGARPRAAVELLRRAAMDLRQGAQRALGSFRPPADLPKYGHAGFPTIWWWDAEKAAKVRSARD